jgi:hypothetical protein
LSVDDLKDDLKGVFAHVVVVVVVVVSLASSLLLQHRGTISVRIRVHWNDMAAATKAKSLVAPPRFIINTQSDKSWKILRYLTRGSTDMTEVTVKSVKLFYFEMVSYWKKCCYLLDVAAGILLWRGRTTLSFFGKEISIWFPMDSIALFVAVLVGVGFPELLPSLFLYGIAYCLLCVNYYSSTHASPWKRVRSYRRTGRMSLLGQAPSLIRIEPEKGAKEAETFPSSLLP